MSNKKERKKKNIPRARDANICGHDKVYVKIHATVTAANFKLLITEYSSLVFSD